MYSLFVGGGDGVVPQLRVFISVFLFSIIYSVLVEPTCLGYFVFYVVYVFCFVYIELGKK